MNTFENKQAILILNRLIETCREGWEGFRAAAENIRSGEFRRLFNIFSQRHAQFMTELRAEVHRLGGNPEAIQILNDSASFGWSMETDASDEGGIIADCRRRGESAVNRFREALNAQLPLDVEYVVKRQYMEIKDVCDRLHILQRAA